MIRAVCALLAVVGLAACSGPLGNEDFIKIPRTGDKAAKTRADADRRAQGWCERFGRRAVRDDDGDPGFYRYDCR